mgnify:CR=1 FL=1
MFPILFPSEDNELTDDETDKIVDGFLHKQERWYQIFPQFIQPFIEKIDNYNLYHQLPKQLQILNFNSFE